MRYNVYYEQLYGHMFHDRGVMDGELKASKGLA